MSLPRDSEDEWFDDPCECDDADRVERPSRERYMICQRCGELESNRCEKYCTNCRKAVLRELDAAGYLTKRPQYKERYRTPEKREDIHETKRGVER